MKTKIALALLWLAFTTYAFGFAPTANPADPGGMNEIVALIQGKGEPLILALFNVMGLIPVLYLFLLIPDGHGQKLPAWPFGILMFAIGAFVLIPYLVFRKPHSEWPQPKKAGLAVRIFDVRWLALFFVALTVGTLANGVIHGNWSIFIEQWQQSRFINVMSFDFVLSSLLLGILIPDDLKRRGVKDSPFQWSGALPLVGPMVYLVLRPDLPRES